MPRPKRLLMWLAYLYLSLVARLEGKPIVVVAHTMGIDAKRLAQLRDELIPKQAVKVSHESSEFELVLCAFAKECNMPANRVREAVTRATPRTA